MSVPGRAVFRLSVIFALFWANWVLSPAAFGSDPPATAQHDLSRQEILRLLHKVNDWQIAHPLMPADNYDWERATWYTGVMAAWKSTRDRSFFDQALAWGRQHQWQVGTEPDGANRLFCVETWLELYFVEKNQAMIQPVIQWLDEPAPNSPGGARVWYLENGLRYADSLYGASALAMLGKATHQRKYLDIMHAFFEDVTSELLDKDSGLYYRDRRYIGRKTANGKKIFWSRGNGWVFAGIARILEYLPENDPKRTEYLALFRRMAVEIVRRQGADGLWRPNVEDPEDVSVPETSGTGFFCYGLAWGINRGLLSRDEFLPAVKKAWAGLSANVNAEGKVLWGQQVDDQPNLVQRESTHEYVTGTFLLAGSEVFKLAAAR